MMGGIIIGTIGTLFFIVLYQYALYLRHKNIKKMGFESVEEYEGD